MGQYISLSGINGPIDNSASVTAPPPQPDGFTLSGMFDTGGGWVTGVSAPTSSVFSGSTGAGAATVGADPLTVSLNGSTASTQLFGAATSQTKLDRVCVVSTGPATGGLANAWVVHYWLFRDCFISIFQAFGDSPQVSHNLAIDYGAVFFAEFATPSGGVLGSRSSSGWDFTTGKAWNGV
jgi:hypothetical protein